MHSLIHASNMAVKVDMEKVYDRLLWSFILHVLQYFRFHSMFIDMVLLYIANFEYAILINRSPNAWILFYRGLRQGCPLSS